MVSVIHLSDGINDQMQLVPFRHFLQGDLQVLQATTLCREINEPGPVDQVWLWIHDGNRCIGNELAQMSKKSVCMKRSPFLTALPKRRETVHVVGSHVGGIKSSDEGDVSRRTESNVRPRAWILFKMP